MGIGKREGKQEEEERDLGLFSGSPVSSPVASDGKDPFPSYLTIF